MKIPVVDFSAGSIEKWSETGGEELKNLAKDLYAALTDYGFVYLKNFGITSDDILQIRQCMSRFFSLPEEIKTKYRRQEEENHGWVPLLQESLDPITPGDLKESFNVTNDYCKGWPDKDVDGMQAEVEKFLSKCEILSHRILELLAIELGISGDFFRKCHHLKSTDNQSALRCLHYPAVPPDLALQPGQLRCGAHTDWGSITLLFQDDVGGLQVMDKDGEWIDATPVEDAVLINIADMMQRWCNNQLKSTMHRVVIASGDANIRAKARMSMAYFTIPDNDFPVKSLLGHSDLPPVTSAEYIHEKITSTSHY